MREHAWIREVLIDLEKFASTNELPGELTAAIALAANTARVELTPAKGLHRKYPT